MHKLNLLRQIIWSRMNPRRDTPKVNRRLTEREHHRRMRIFTHYLTLIKATSRDTRENKST